MQLTDIQKQMMATFLSLRVGIGLIGIVFPFLLWWGGYIFYHLPQADSMSAYYHATTACIDPHLENTPPTQCAADPLPTGQGPMRNWFVGLLFAIGVGLYLVKGFSKPENVLLTIAGLLAVCVALFPMPWERGKPTWQHVHYISAVTFFILIGLVIWICSGKTLKFMPEIPNRDKWIAFYKHTYRFLAIVMAASPFTAILLFKVLRMPQGIFWAEALGVVSFGAFWLVKTWELSKSEVEHRAIRGEINMDISKLR